jgi:hypothetical protein
MLPNPQPALQIRLSSDRSFGLVFTTLFTLLALAPLRQSLPPRLPFLAAAAVLLLLSLAAPKLLHGPNLLWAQLAALLHRLFSPIFLGVLFFGVFTPIGFLYRLLQPTAKNTAKAGPSYWIPRTPPGPAPESLLNQF